MSRFEEAKERVFTDHAGLMEHLAEESRRSAVRENLHNARMRAWASAGRRVYGVGWSLYYSRPMALARAFLRGLRGR